MPQKVETRSSASHRPLQIKELTGIVSARAGSWQQAERLAQTGRDRRDQVKRRLHEIERQEVQKQSLQKAQNITVREAVGRWLSTLHLPDKNNNEHRIEIFERRVQGS